MKIALSQINPTVGDLDGNIAKIESSIEESRRRGAQLCVFSEMAVTGYPAAGLLENRSFTGLSKELVQKLAKRTKGIAALVGYPAPNPNRGKPAVSEAALIENGAIASIHQKRSLDAYREYDERLYIEPSKETSTAKLQEKTLCIAFGDEIFDADANPAADIAINIAGVPFDLYARGKRQARLADAAKRGGFPIAFVNQVGGNDELVFDGRSAVVGLDGSLLAMAKELTEDLVLVDLDTGVGDVRNPLAGNDAAAVDALVLGARDFAVKCGFKSALVGLSGGIDSAVVAAIASRALGPKNVHGVAMPTRYSSQGSLDDAKSLADNLGINFHSAPIDKVFQTLLDQLAPLFDGAAPDVTEENLQARIRCIVLMSLSNKFGHLLLSTGNRSEAATGYATLYGDIAGGLAVLADLPKGLVYRIAAEINRTGNAIPQATMQKPPSAELRPDQKDEDSLPPYHLLDAILELCIDKGMDAGEIAKKGFDRAVVSDVLAMMRRSEFKRRQAPPGLRITTRAIGQKTTMPIAHRWKERF